MPASQTFAFIYDFDFSAPNSGTVYPAPTAGTFTIEDSIDGSDDNQTSAPGSLAVTAGGGELPAGAVALYTGTTANGDPIVQYNGQNYVLSNDGGLAGDTIGTIGTDPYPYCFAKGTMIETSTGPRAVEELQIGDALLAADGRVVAVKWVGVQTVMPLFAPAERLMPVRFAAGSLGGGLPHSDLTVTADHAMLVDGVLCNAGALVNGSSIVRVPLAEMGETFAVYHIETEDHEIILANGAQAETFIDNVSRRVFDNFAEFEALYGDVPEMQELPLPRALSARQVPASIRARLSGKRAA